MDKKTKLGIGGTVLVLLFISIVVLVPHISTDAKEEIITYSEDGTIAIINTDASEEQVANAITALKAEGYEYKFTYLRATDQTFQHDSCIVFEKEG